MSHVLDAHPSALPRSLALSSLSYLTLVVLLLLARTLLPARVVPPTPWIDLPVPPHVFEHPVVVDPEPYVPPVRPTVANGVVVPVDPRQQVDPGILPRQDSMPAWPGVQGVGAGSGTPSLGGGGGQATAPPSDDPPLGEWIPTDSMPVLVHTVLPKYPPIAEQAGMEGSVVLLMLVGRDGRVRRAQVAHPGTLFDDEAVAAGLQFVFTPATMNGHPVAVWVSQQIRFVLH